MKVERIGEVMWTISDLPEEAKAKPLIIGTVDIVSTLGKDNTLKQLINVCCIDGVVGNVVLMPDAHEGYGFPIGAVAATPHKSGFISPGGIGYDINCGVRLITTPFTIEENIVRERLKKLVNEIFDAVPSGVGREGHYSFSMKELDEITEKGVPYLIEKGFGIPQDVDSIESGGRIPDADAEKVSEKAKERGRGQLGTMGAGNHFVEVDKVEEVYDEKIAERLGIRKNQICILIHTGSRGYGHQVATDYIRIFLSKISKWGINLRDRELVYAPIDSEEGRSYWHAMCCAANFAFANRQLITHSIRKVFRKLFGVKDEELRILYDVAHNIAKIERHKIDGKLMKVVVHRKGATRSYGPSHPELPPIYRETGQPVLIPGSMGTSSYLLCGTDKSFDISLGSCCHGAGRQMSRAAATKQFNAGALKKELGEMGIHVSAGSNRGLVEEAPLAYKNVDIVVESVVKAGIAVAVAKLEPVGVIKG